MLKHKLLGATAGAEVVAIEDVFSTYLFTGTGAALTINNGIDLAGEGGLVWQKSRTNAAYDHNLFDTARGVTKKLLTNTNLGEITQTTYLTAFNANGFSVGTDAGYNQSGAGIVTWTFRQAPRFFDVVTYTGTGANRTIAHDLGVVPGCIIVKRTDTTGDWQVYHRSNTAAPETDYLVLNTTAATVDDNTRWNDTLPTSTVFSLGTATTVNASGGTYVAYLFAHDPLGPSGDGSDGLIACGSYTGNGLAAGPTVTLGWEPQWLLVKDASGTNNWFIWDVLRGLPANVANSSASLYPNLSNAEFKEYGTAPTPTGFQIQDNNAAINTSGRTYTYIAIRRGPMREPTSGTEVFAVDRGDGTTTNPQFVSGFAVDLGLWRAIGAGNNWETASRITGQYYLRTNTTDSQLGPDADIDWDFMTGFYGPVRNTDFYSWMFRRAPGFFDVVAYTGTGAVKTNSHNLGVVPELMIIKNRGSATNWAVYHKDVGATKAIYLNDTGIPVTSSAFFNDTVPTDTQFTVNFSGTTGDTANNYIAYLFATLPGISKIGTYTGNGTTQTIDCGFTAGARFVLIKRTDTADAWYVWDTARGIVAGNDPYLQLNSTAAEVTSTDHIDPANSGFTLATSFLGTNNSAGTYIYLAIA